jgi:hypothetical protein
VVLFLAYGQFSPDLKGVALVQRLNQTVKKSGIALLALALASGAVVYASAPPIPPANDASLTSAQSGQLKAYVQYWCNRLKATKSHAEMVHAANRLLRPLKTPAHQPSAVFSYDYGNIISHALRPMLNDPKRQLVAAVVLGRVNDLSTQSSLEMALKSDNAGVRYWGAVGLTRILPQLQSIPPAYQEAEDKLVTALKVEKSPLVAAKIASALAQFSPVPAGVFSSLDKVLGAQASLFAQRPPSTVAQAGALAQAMMEVLDAHVQPSPAEKTSAATHLTQLLSFTCQYWALKRLDRTQSELAPSAMTNFCNALNALTGTTVFTISGLSSSSNKAATLLAVNELTGSQGQSGTIQKIFPKTPIPPRVGGK